jgi:hypothetical protein
MGTTADLQLSPEAPAPSPAVSVDVTVSPVLSHALAVHAIPVISRLTLTSDRPLRGATLRLSVQHADGPVGPAVERLVDLDAGRTTVLHDPGLVLDPAALQQVQERRPGWVRADLEDDGQLLAQRRIPVHVLAPGQWLAAPLPLALELLAAHVQPHHPAVGELVAEAAELLAEGTGDPRLAGHGDDPERVDEIVEALTWAVRRREIRYSEPPASWADVGQRIRTPGEVLDGRVGTSLDTVVTLAAACERAGVRPLVWLVEGHAFLGYWRAEGGAETSGTTDATALVELVHRGLIRLVETTLLTDRGDTRTDLHGPASAWLSGDRSRVIGVTDVHQARLAGIRPLPASTRDAGATPGATPGAEHRTDRVRQRPGAPLDPRLRTRLIDHPAGAGLAVTVPAGAFPVLAELVGTGASITLLPDDRTTDVPPTALLAEHRSVHVDVPERGYLPRLRALAHRARTAVEETGANGLHLALGALHWELGGRPLRSPLVLLPVVLTPANGTSAARLTVDESGAPTLNGCLLEELRRLRGLTVPGLVGQDAEEGVARDVGAALQAVRTAIAEHGLPWQVADTAELSVLPSASFRSWQDLDAHSAQLAANPLVARLLGDPTGPFVDPAPAPSGPVDLDELAAGCPLPADASQLSAVAEAVAGRTFVLEGAPGTGKSQTITNLVARAAAEGKRVLVVAEKGAALDVLARRLDAIGMGTFVLDLHGKASRPAVVRARIRAALDHEVDVDEPGLAADVEGLRSASRSLARYAQRLHAANPAGLSLYSARTAVLAAGEDVAALPVTTAFAGRADADVVTGVRRALALLPDIAGLARPSAGHAWGFLDTVELDITAVQQAAVAVDTAIRELPGEGGPAAAVRAARTPEDLDALVHLLAGPRVGLDVLDEVRSARWAAATSELGSEVAALTAAAHPCWEVLTPAVLELPLADLAARARSAGTAGWWTRRRTLGALRDQLAPVLRPGATVKGRDLPELLESVGALQAAVHTIAAGAAAIPGLQVPAGWNPFTDEGRHVLDAEVRWLRRAAASVDGTIGFPGALRRFLAAGPVADPAAARAVVRLRDAVSCLLTVCSSSSAQLTDWCGEHGLVLRWTITRPERGVEYVHPMSLRRWVSLLDTLEPLRLAGLAEARAQLRNGLVAAEDAVRAFDRGLAEASVAERLAATGLDAFEKGRHERTVTRFTATARAVRSHLRTALPAEVLAARPVAAAADQVAALRRELGEPDRGLSVRGLLSAHGELIGALLPCVLASPESVARFIPATAGLFDLVVFDEASRIRVADALGALGRARAAVVVGDSQQLPPAPLGTPGAPDGDAVLDAADAEEDSILTACLQAGLPRRRLTWHYRSQDETLIAFSNARYYGDRLSTFPAPAHGPASPAPEGSGISLVRVDGTFLRSGPGLRTNPVEAQAVVAEVLRRFDAAAPAVPSIGVVTVTAPQRTLIETLLRDSGDERVAEALDRSDGEGLFVKDLENVQGDERDVVLFCLGFSADRSGRLPLSFGPLNRRGGERRLNVAITRARRQVVVFSSFDPEQLRAEETSSVGITHLRAYLELAALGSDALPRRPRAAGADDRHRDEVAAALRERGLVVRSDVGLSDFRVDLTVARPEAPDTPVLAVLLDGPAWARRETVGDRDGLPVEVLGELRGWPAVERVWLPTWSADRAEVVDRLVAAVDGAAPAAVEPEPVEDEEPYDGPLADVIPLRPASVVPEPEREPIAVVGGAPAPKAAPVAAVRSPAPVPLGDEQPFIAWAPKPAGEKKQLDQLSDPAVARLVRRVLTAGLKAEGPVHRDRLTRLTAGAFGLSRVTEARRDALLALLPNSAAPVGEFVWPAGLDPDSWTFFRRQASSAQRPLEHVAPEEIGNAMVALTRAGAASSRDELYRRTLEVFGHRRRTPALLPLLDAALAAVVGRGRLTEQPDGTLTS